MVDNIAILHRNLIDRLLDGLADTTAVLVNGARQTGKSSLVQSAELAKQDRQSSPLMILAF
jgi:predicted AAA+ superfamily ATPase